MSKQQQQEQNQHQETKGIFLFKDKEDDEICLFLFYRLTPAQIKIALPNIDENIPGNYFVGIWKKGLDYLGKTEYNGILSIKKQEELVNIEKNYDEIFQKLNISQEEYNKYKEFAYKHLKTFVSIQENVP